MKKQFLMFALASALTCGTGMLLAQDQQPAPPPDDQAQPSGQVQGQARRGPMDPDAQAANLQRRLNLTDDQVAQIKPVLVDRQQQMMAVRDDTSLQPQDKMAKVRSIMQDSDVKIKAVLNDDQKTKYDAMEQQMRNRMRDRMQQRRQGGADQNQPQQ